MAVASCCTQKMKILCKVSQGMAGSTRHSQAYIRQHLSHSEPQKQTNMTSGSFWLSETMQPWYKD